jgi:hypothetical protein
MHLTVNHTVICVHGNVTCMQVSYQAPSMRMWLLISVLSAAEMHSVSSFTSVSAKQRV